MRPRLAAGLPCSVLSFGRFPLRVGAYPLAEGLALPGLQTVGIAHLASHLVVVDDGLDKPLLAKTAHGAVDGAYNALRLFSDI